MGMTASDLAHLRARSPAWRLLRADSAPFAASFLHDVFVAGNRRGVPERELAELLDDHLYRARQADPEAMPRSPREYLRDWADVERCGWLRSSYPDGADEPHYDVTPAAERALAWLEGLTERSFIGTESRLLTLFDLLRSMIEGTETDPEERIRALEARRDEIDAEIDAVRRGEVQVLDDTAVRDRFQQFETGAIDLLRDFRQVEENFRGLDRGVRERIAGWDGARGELLETVFFERESIGASDQGKSFRAFWDLLMSSTRQDELNDLVVSVLELPAINSPRSPIRDILNDWLVAGDAVQRTVAQLSKQMRRFLDTQACLDNRRIAELIRSIESSALSLRDNPPAAAVLSIDEAKADINLPMMRSLFQQTRELEVDSSQVRDAAPEVDTEALFDQVAVDTRALRRAVDRALAQRDQVTLADVIDAEPLELGLAEVVGYLKVADDDSSAVIDDESRQTVSWEADGEARSADVPLVIFAARDDRDG